MLRFRTVVFAFLIACAATASAQRPGTTESLPTPPAQLDLSEPMREVPEADGQPDALEELRARMEAIEKENSSLQDEIEKLKKDSKKKPDPVSMSAKWNSGLELQSADKKFKIHLGGRTQLDGVWIQNTSNLAGSGGAMGDDAVDFRRARLRADGTMYEIIDWAAEFDFANSFNDNVGLQPASEANVSNVPAPTDLWFNISKVPIFGNFRLGNMKEPIGMEHLESSRFLEFMERSFNQDVFTGAFNNGFTPGIMLWDMFDEKRGTWATGLYKNTANAFAFNTGDGEYAWTSRISYLLWFEDEGEKLLHVGVAGSIRQPDNNTARYRTRASLRNGPGALNPLMADTGNFHCTQEDFLAGEVAMNYGPFCFQAEYLGAWNQNSVGNFGAFAGVPLGTTFVHGGYAEVLLFLTGESRAYEHERGAFGRVKPKQNFEWSGCGCGAWQIGARVAHLDLDGDGLLGGKVDDATLGLNWFLNPNMKFQWNYVCTWRDSTRNGVDGTIHGFGMRLAQDF